MNLEKINSIRATMHLSPLTSDPFKKEKARRRSANLAARAEESRRLRSIRSGSGKKGK